jgi:molybdopterin-binding protein
MWYHTKTHMLLGVYQTSKDCGLSMSHLRLVNIATGRVDNDIDLDCGAGLLMTSIFENVSRAATAHQVTVEFGRGQGYEEVVDIELGTARGQ